MVTDGLSPVDREAVIRFEAVRDALASCGLDGCVIKDLDRLNLASRYNYVSWLTGRSYRRGVIIVLPKAAALFVRSREVKSAKESQVHDCFSLIESLHIQPYQWILQNIKRGGKIGYYSRAHSHYEIMRLIGKCSALGVELFAMEPHPIDLIRRNLHVHRPIRHS